MDDAEFDENVFANFKGYLPLLETFIEEWNSESEDDKLVRSNPQALFLSIKSMHDDVVRYKRYHLDDPREGMSNSVKYCAYLCKWLCRFKVIELISNKDDSQDDISAILLNGAFALHMCRDIIGAELRTPFFYEGQYFDEFQYDLLFRELGEDGLLHIFQMIFSAVKIRKAALLEFVDETVANSVFDD